MDKSKMEAIYLLTSKNISGEILKEINKIYQLINNKFFKNELDSKVFITIINDFEPKKRSILGIYHDKIWSDNISQITLKSRNFDGKIENIISSLWHEMIHKIASQRNINDTEINGRHNKKFKQLCLEFGLKPTEPVSKNIGYGTMLDPDKFNELKLDKINIELLENLTETYFPKEKPKKKNEKKKSYKYICPNCLYKFTLTKLLNIKCNDCGSDYKV